ncbi:MAG: non-canonical purine NTP pyrophosphatase [Lachnospirales bacterium]
MEILFGTTNSAKLETMRRYLDGMGLEILSLRDFISVPEVQEAGRDPLQNARTKAWAYWRFYHRPVFSCDTGLWIRELPDRLQPGVHVRRRDGRCMEDSEMTAYYAGLAEQYGRLTAQYQNAICLILDEQHCYEEMSKDLSGDPFWITDRPHPKTVEGYPLDRISLVIPSGEYYYESDSQEEDHLRAVFRRFFRQSLVDWEREHQ